MYFQYLLIHFKENRMLYERFTIIFSEFCFRNKTFNNINRKITTKINVSMNKPKY